MSSGDHTWLCDVEEFGSMCDGETVRFSPTSVIDVGGAQHIWWGSPHLLG